MTIINRVPFETQLFPFNAAISWEENRRQITTNTTVRHPLGSALTSKSFIINTENPLATFFFFLDVENTRAYQFPG